MSDTGNNLLLKSYVLKHMDLMRNWNDIKVEKVNVCNLCSEDCESMGHL